MFVNTMTDQFDQEGKPRERNENDVASGKHRGSIYFWEFIFAGQ